MITKTLIWCIVFPTLVFKHMLLHTFEIVWFLFNAPVDVWVSISNIIEKHQEETP